VMGTRAHQLALFVVFESPLQMVSDHPGAYEGQKAFEFIRAVPATWDETRVLQARVPDTVTVARRRGREWYVGSITGWRPEEVSVPLDFLGRGEYLATVYADAPDSGTNPKNTTIEERKVNSAAKLVMRLAPGGGQAIRIRPAP